MIAETTQKEDGYGEKGYRENNNDLGHIDPLRIWRCML